MNKREQKKTILIAAGGTGGHVLPALAITESLRAKGYDIHWLGTAAGIESRLVVEAGICIHYLKVKGLRGKGLRWLLAPWQLLRSLCQALLVVWKIKPCAVLCMGGYVSGPSGIAAWLARKPLLIHEQNAIAGMTNKILSKVANAVMIAFPGTFSERKGVLVTGNPLRTSLLNLPPPEQRFAGRTGALRLLVLGGSQGAKIFNELLPKALQLLPLAARPEVWHQAGTSLFAMANSNYQDAKVSVRIEPFIADMASAYCWADLVICRAGALTVTELAAVGVGALLVPLPFAVDDHQRHNAEPLVAIGGALLLEQKLLTKEMLSDYISTFNNDRKRLLAMAQAAKRLANLSATAKVVQYCQELCGEH